MDGALCECALCLFTDKAASAREVARVLRPGARLALSDVTAWPARLPVALRSLAAYVACVGDARPLVETAAILETAGLVVEEVEQHNDALAEMIDRIGSRLRLARWLASGPLGAYLDQADEIVRAAADAVTEGVIGYGVIIARRHA